MTYLVQTPTALVELTQADYNMYFALYRALLRRLGNFPLDFATWVRHYGLPTDAYIFGDAVWSGMANHAWPHYRRLQGKSAWLLEASETQFWGWFRAPEPLSKHGSMQPPSAADTFHYPAIFFVFNNVLYMVCLAMAYQGGQAWVVHEMRVTRVQ